jgi:Immunity protein Imm6
MNMRMLEHADPRQRVAFALALGWAVLPQLQTSSSRHSDARAALEEASRWLAGQPVQAKLMTERLQNDNDEGVFIHAQLCPEGEREAWGVLGTALAYTAWQAWRDQGDLPSPLVIEFNEGTLPELCALALTAGVPADMIDRLRMHIEANAGRAPDLPTLLALLT